MKHSKQSLLGGAVAISLLVALTITAGAASIQLLYNQVSISLLGHQQISACQTATGQNGADLPTSISYVDEKGGLTNYLSVRQISEILDADLYWNDSSKTVELGRSAPIPSGGTSITLPDGSNLGESADKAQETTDTAPFTEVDTIIPKADAKVAYLLPQSRFQCETAFNFGREFYCTPNGGNYVTVSVTNQNINSSEPVYFTLYRVKTIGEDVQMPTVAVAPGETVTRTLEIAPDANPLAYEFGVYVTPYVENYETDVSVEVMQFD